MLVEGLQYLGHSVATTADGTNDLPSLEKSDVSIAKGITGTDVVKSASDMILMDDDFASILGAMIQARSFHANMKKVLQFIMTSNLTIMVSVLLGVCVYGDSPLSFFQLIWVFVVLYNLGALALAVEPPKGDELDCPP